MFNSNDQLVATWLIRGHCRIDDRHLGHGRAADAHDHDRDVVRAASKIRQFDEKLARFGRRQRTGDGADLVVG